MWTALLLLIGVTIAAVMIALPTILSKSRKK